MSAASALGSMGSSASPETMMPLASRFMTACEAQVGTSPSVSI